MEYVHDIYKNLDAHKVELEDGKVALVYLPKIFFRNDMERLVKMLESLVID